MLLKLIGALSAKATGRPLAAPYFGVARFFFSSSFFFFSSSFFRMSLAFSLRRFASASSSLGVLFVAPGVRGNVVSF
ncbi:hypothetical protein [Micromonospora sp. RTP1Z1]|uniref:hypothetical protein n=1 Tax=Micromonospora sp. RTP1Z1 TaxID=2994043 RepID=UPI0029C79B36|nr:hypothetical protein [Micromonospora sp. RTP1Z1]